MSGIVKWKTSSWELKITPVTVLRETEQSVFLEGRWNKGKERREAKLSEGHQYHDTWEAAHNYLLERVGKELERVRLKLQRAQGEYGTVKGMKPPTDMAQPAK